MVPKEGKKSAQQFDVVSKERKTKKVKKAKEMYARNASGGSDSGGD